MRKDLDAERIRDDRDETETIYTRWIDHSLGYSKIEGTWPLGFREEEWRESPDDYGVMQNEMLQSSVHPLLFANRELRIRMASSLPSFLKAYNDHVAKLAGNLDSSN